MKPIRLAKNALLALSTVREHLGDDPAVLALQISRRLPGPVIRPLADAVALAPGPLLPAMSDLVRGRLKDVEVRLAGAAGGASPRMAVRLADVAIAAGLPSQAEELLNGAASTTPGWAAAQARLRWYLGDMSGALTVLDQGARTRAERRQRARLASELTVFEGWAPTLPPNRSYHGEPETVLHILTNSLPGTGSGYAQRSHSLLRAQHEYGWNVHAVTRIGYPVQVGKLWADDTDVLDGVVYHRIIPHRLAHGMAARLQQQTEAVMALALQIRPSVLHTTTHFVNGLVTAAVAEALDIPWVYEVRGQLADTWASTREQNAILSERYRQFRARETQMVGRAGLVATLGSAMKKEILAAGSERRDILLLPNAVGDDFLAMPAEPSKAREILGLPEGSAVVGTVSSLVEYEGIDDLLRAFALVAPIHPSAYCLIVGDGSAGPSLKTLAAELGIADRVIFAGRVPRTAAHLWHQALDVFVVPRKDLSVTRAVTPLKPVEASASARPVAVSDLPALRELVEDGVTGIVFQPGNPASLADALERLMSDGDLRSRLGRAGRQTVLAERTWAANASAAVAAYSGLRRVS